MSRALPASKVSSITTMTTDPEVNRLYAAWRRLGVNFSVTACTEMVEVEPLILATAASRDVGVSYAAAHAAVERLVGRGLLLRHRNGARPAPSGASIASDNIIPR